MLFRSYVWLDNLTMKITNSMSIEIYSFFSGLGLLDLGFENVGFDIVFVDEVNPKFLYAYQFARRHKSHEPRYGYSCRDIREFLSVSMLLKNLAQIVFGPDQKPMFNVVENRMFSFGAIQISWVQIMIIGTGCLLRMPTGRKSRQPPTTDRKSVV